MPSLVEIELILKDSRYHSALKSVRSSLKSLQTTLVSVGRQARNFLLVGGAALAFFVKTASDFEETSSKFDAVFKDQSDTVRLWVQDLAKSLQRSEVDLLAYMARLQDTFVPMGFAREEATGFAKDLTQLGIDLASFNNIADDEVITALTSALVGNHEAVRIFGISITAASLDMELLANGFPKVTKGATAQQKAVARLNLMMKASSDAQGDALRTSESFENQMKGLLASFITTSVAIGSVFIPALKDLIKVIRPWLESVAVWIERNSELVFKITAVVASMAGLLTVLPLAGALLIGLTFAIQGVSTAMLFLAANPLVALTLAVAAVVVVVIGLSKHIKNLEQQMLDFGNEVDPQITTLENWKNATKELQATLRQDDFSDAGVLELHFAYKKAHISATKFAEAIREAGGEGGVIFEGAVKRMNDLERAMHLTGNQVKIIKERQKEAANDTKALATEEERLSKIVEKAEEVLKFRIDTYNQDTLAKQRSKLAAEGASDAELALFDSLQGQIRVLDEIAKKRKAAEDTRKGQKDAAKSLIASLRTQEQIVVEKEKEFEAMFALGDITADQLEQAKESLKVKKAEQALSFSSFQSAINRIQGASFRRDERFQGQKSDSKNKKTPTTVAVEKQTGEIKILGKSIIDIGKSFVDAFNPVGVFGS